MTAPAIVPAITPGVNGGFHPGPLVRPVATPTRTITVGEALDRGLLAYRQAGARPNARPIPAAEAKPKGTPLYLMTAADRTAIEHELATRYERAQAAERERREERARRAQAAPRAERVVQAPRRRTPPMLRVVVHDQIHAGRVVRDHGPYLPREPRRDPLFERKRGVAWDYATHSDIETRQVYASAQVAEGQEYLAGKRFGGDKAARGDFYGDLRDAGSGELRGLAKAREYDAEVRHAWPDPCHDPVETAPYAGLPGPEERADELTDDLDYQRQLMQEYLQDAWRCRAALKDHERERALACRDAQHFAAWRRQKQRLQGELSRARFEFRQCRERRLELLDRRAELRRERQGVAA